jgi:hypothetical protein
MTHQDALNLGLPQVEVLKLLKVEANVRVVDEVNLYLVVLRDGLRAMKITVGINPPLALHNSC